MGASGIRAGKAYVELGVKDALSKGLNAAKARLAAFGSAVRNVGFGIAGLGSAAIAPMLLSVKQFADSGSALKDMSDRTGLSVERLSELGYAAQQTGASIEDVERSIRKAQQNGSGSLEDIADKIAAVQDPAERTKLAMELMGKSGAALIPMLSGGRAGLAVFAAEARRLGLVISTEAAESADALGDAIDKMRLASQAAFRVIGEALAPILTDVANRFSLIAASVGRLIRENKQLVIWAAGIAVGLVVAGSALVSFGLAMAGLSAAIGGLMTVAGIVGSALSAVGAVVAALVSPIGIAVAEIVVLGATLFDFSDYAGKALAWVGDRFRELKGAVTKVVGGIIDALKAGDIKLAADILWKSLKVAWLTGVNALNGIWVSVKNFFVSTAYEMWYGLLEAYEIVVGKLRTWWADLIAFLARVWESDFLTDVKKGLWDLIGGLAKVIVPFQFIGSGLSDEERIKAIAEAEKQIDRDVAGRQEEIDKGRADRLKKIDEEHRARVAEIESERDKHLADLASKAFDAEQKLQAARGDEEAKAQEELDAARKALDDAIAKAKTEREAEDKKLLPEAPGKRALSVEDAAEKIKAGAERISVVGTFNPMATFGFTGGVTGLFLDSIKKIERHTERTARAAESGGPVFAGP